MNRLGLGLAVGAGYVLGRTKKMKLAFAVGTMVAGKRMHLSPRALADLVSGQLQNNPQFKEIGDQLREDLRGVGKAASGALVERQIEGLADRLHGRTAQVRDQLSGVVPDVPGVGGKSGGRSRGDRKDEPEDEYAYEDGPEDYDEYDERDPEASHDEERPPPRKRAPAQKAAKKVPAKKAAEKRSPRKEAPAKKTAARAAKKAPAKKTAAAKTAGRRASRGRLTRGGGDND